MVVFSVLLNIALALPEKILVPTGPSYLGVLTPEHCERRCDVVVVDPWTGALVVEHVADIRKPNQDIWRYTDKEWIHLQQTEDSLRSDLEKYPESITDAWGVVIRYEYTKKLLTKIQWDTGQEIRIVYDKKDRVVELQGPGTERRGFQWSNTVYNSMVDQVGYSVSWKITPNAIDTADSWGHTVHTEYAFGMISAWTDPRGIRSTVSKKDNVLYVNYAGIRNWAIALQDKRVLSIEQPGFGAWKWKYDKQDRIVELAEAQNIRTSSIQYPTPQKQRVQKQGGWLDIQYDRPYTENGFAKILSISDISGTLVSIQRNAQGQAKKIEDALGGEIHIDRDMTGYPTTVVFRNGQSWQLEYDVFHRIRTIISPQQDTWQIQRDHLGRITKIQRSFWGEEVYVRDAYGRIVQIKHANGLETKIHRDVYGNVVSVEEDVFTDSPVVSVLETDTTTISKQVPIKTNRYTMTRDMIGNITQIQSPVQEYNLTRDIFGHISKWNSTTMQYDVWGNIVSHTNGVSTWTLYRDETGLLSTVSAEDQYIDVVYDDNGLAIAWQKGDNIRTVERNHLGWITRDGTGVVHRDRRGWVQSISVHELDWKWRYDASGYALQVKGPYDMTLGLNRSNWGQISEIRYPSTGYMQYTMDKHRLQQEYIDSSGVVAQGIAYDFLDNITTLTTEPPPISTIEQVSDSDPLANLLIHEDVSMIEDPLLQLLEDMDGSSETPTDTVLSTDNIGKMDNFVALEKVGALHSDAQNRLVQGEFASPAAFWGRNTTGKFSYTYDDIGLRTVETDDFIAVLEYDPFYFLQQICYGSMCQNYTYDAQGYLEFWEDGTDIPTVLQWFVDPISKRYRPYMMGGSVAICDENSVLLQSNGKDVVENFAWIHQSDVQENLEHTARENIHEYFRYTDNSLQLQPMGPYFQEGMAREPISKQRLQADKPWLGTTKSAEMFAMASQLSIWNDPLRLMQGMDMITMDDTWFSLYTKEERVPFDWMSVPWQQLQTRYIEASSVPLLEQHRISVYDIEFWITQRLLRGEEDPSIQEVLSFLLQTSDITDSYWYTMDPKRVKDRNKCVSSLAFFYECR